MNNDACMFIFLENLRRLQRREGLSLCEMAKKLGVGVKTLEQLESGVISSYLSSGIVFKIQNEFNVEAKTQFSELISLEKT